MRAHPTSSPTISLDIEWCLTAGVVGVASFTRGGVTLKRPSVADQQAVADCVAQLLRPPIDEGLAVCFCDLTTIRTEGHTQQDGDARRFGMSEDGAIARHFMLGVLQTADGRPIFHAVFDGNAAEAPTLEPTLKKVLARYPHPHGLVGADRGGLRSLDNIEALTKLQVAGDRQPEFILAVPGLRYAEFVVLLRTMAAQAVQTSEAIVTEAKRQGHRLVVAHSPVRLAEQTQVRHTRAYALQQQAYQSAGKLDDRDEGKVQRGRSGLPCWCAPARQSPGAERSSMPPSVRSPGFAAPLHDKAEAVKS